MLTKSKFLSLSEEEIICYMLEYYSYNDVINIIMKNGVKNKIINEEW